jgi:general secretion pathway protein D
VTLHAAQGDSATFRSGTRFPILNASFAPVFNTPAIANVIQNGSFTAPFPSFNYEDLGLTLKAKPAIHGSSSVTLNLELQLRALGGQSINGVPIINTREYKGMIMVKNGEPAVVAGTISNQEIKSLQGLPIVAQLPGLNKVTGSNENQQNDNELLLVITPHVLSTPTSESTEVWLP